MTTEEIIQISGKLTLEDFIKYNHYHLGKLLKVYFVLCFIVLFFVFQIPMSGDIILIILISGIPSLLLSSLLYYFAKRTRRHFAVREYKSDQLIKLTISYTFKQEGVTQVVRKSQNQYEWTDFLKAREHKEMYLLYLSKNKAMVLPKRFFQTEDQMRRFKSLIVQNLSQTELEND
ncbi:YcxB-like protein [Alkalibacterium subtropicum]|uniref:YcxB-like protein n=1 Tax=Alkalibacterium subtropicum TaxID=753702 RepID=A0A1I1L874_9LACT|nr:YcxB family protein [Alkalibacterium subtropicum]SFC69199.1 YcxB-like protein [Alkalibacterium subtropicum]